MNAQPTQGASYRPRSEGPCPWTLSGAADALRSGELTATALIHDVQSRADKSAEELGTYLARFDDEARQAAARADDELASGHDRGPLHGIPVAVKDVFATREGPTTAQSLVHDRGWGAGRDAPAVARLREAGAVITGKSTTMEFAIGMPDPDKPFPLPRNPWDHDRWSGGSSSGSSNGVAAGLFLAGLGSDTGGSIRIPAAYSGVCGLKPTFGRVPKSGCVPLSYTLDHVGPLARSARDCAAVLGVIAGPERTDPSTADRTVPDYLAALTGSLDGVRIGVERERHFPEGVDDALLPSYEAAIAVLTDLGARITDVRIPGYDEAQSASELTLAAEALAYHREDMIHRWQDYFATTRLWLAFGALVSGADYVQAQRVRAHARHVTRELFRDVDLLAVPTVGGAAPTYADIAVDRLNPTTAASVLFVAYWNLVGNPALAIPMGFTSDGLPLSLQIVGRPFDESSVLRAGDAFQRVTEWHLTRPEPTDAREGNDV